MAKGEYGINLDVMFNPDKQSLDKLDKLFDDFNNVELKVDSDTLRETFNDYLKRRESLLHAEQMLTSLQKVGGQDTQVEELQEYMRKQMGDNASLLAEFGKYTVVIDEAAETAAAAAKDDADKRAQIVSSLKNFVFDKITNLAQSFLSGIAGVFKDAWKELGTMVDSSLLTNSNTRTNAFTYGLNASESYGFDKAKSMLGIQNDEDLMYMNDYQKNKFQEVMTKYAEKYNSLADSGFFEKYQDFQIEMQEFKLDMQMEVIGFIMENKDTIKQFLSITISAMKFLVKTVGGIFDIFSDGSTSEDTKAANISDVIRSYTTSHSQVINQTNNNTVNASNGALATQSQNVLDTLNAQTLEAIKSLGG